MGSPRQPVGPDRANPMWTTPARTRAGRPFSTAGLGPVAARQVARAMPHRCTHHQPRVPSEMNCHVREARGCLPQRIRLTARTTRAPADRRLYCRNWLWHSGSPSQRRCSIMTLPFICPLFSASGFGSSSSSVRTRHDEAAEAVQVHRGPTGAGRGSTLSPIEKGDTHSVATRSLAARAASVLTPFRPPNAGVVGDDDLGARVVQHTPPAARLPPQPGAEVVLSAQVGALRIQHVCEVEQGAAIEGLGDLRGRPDVVPIRVALDMSQSGAWFSCLRSRYRRRSAGYLHVFLVQIFLRKAPPADGRRRS